MRGLTGAPSLQALQNYSVNKEGQPEVIWQPLYDIQAYPTAGALQFKFFQTPAGSSSKTFADTNMEAAGVIPVPENHLITSIEVVFFPGGAPGNTAATGANIGDNWNDVNAVAKAGWVEIFIGAKTYLRDAPVGRFPPSFRLSGAAAVTTTATTEFNQIDYAVFSGQLYEVVPLRLIAQQNFNVTANFPALVPTPSGVDGRIGIRLNGFRYRSAQ